MRWVAPAPHHAIGSNDRIAAQLCASKYSSANSDPTAFRYDNCFSPAVGLLHDWNLWMSVAVIVIADKNPLGQNDMIFDDNRIRARHKCKAPDLAGMINADLPVVFIILRKKCVAVSIFDVVAYKR